jgi:hypothetical protein
LAGADDEDSDGVTKGTDLSEGKGTEEVKVEEDKDEDV